MIDINKTKNDIKISIALDFTIFSRIPHVTITLEATFYCFSGSCFLDIVKMISNQLAYLYFSYLCGYVQIVGRPWRRRKDEQLLIPIYW